MRYVSMRGVEMTPNMREEDETHTVKGDEMMRADEIRQDKFGLDKKRRDTNKQARYDNPR